MLEESCPIEVFAAELRRRIQENSGDAQKNLQTLSGSDTKIETVIAENLAREKGMWVEFSHLAMVVYIPFYARTLF